MNDLEVIQVSVAPGRQGTCAMAGAAIGLGVGFALGTAASDGGGVVDPVPGGFIFAPLVAVIGAAMGPGERWETVPTESVFVAVGRSPDTGTGLALSFRF